MSDEQEQEEDKRTKVLIGSNSMFGTKEQFVMAYDLEKDSNGDVYVDGNGSVVKLKKLGGTKVGSVGRICGHTVKAYRNALADYERGTATLGQDLVDMIPIELTEYKRMAFFPQSVIKVIG